MTAAGNGRTLLGVSEGEHSTGSLAAPATASGDGPPTGERRRGGDSRCEAETTVGDVLYRCALEEGHAGQHAFQAAAAAEPGDRGDGAPDGDAPEVDALTDVRELVGSKLTDGTATVEQVRDLLGEFVQTFEVYNTSSRTKTCDECGGYGGLFTGALTGDGRLATCWKCQGAGYIAAGYGGGQQEDRPPGPDPITPPAAQGFDATRVPPEQGGQPPAPGMTWDPQQGLWGFWNG